MVSLESAQKAMTRRGEIAKGFIISEKPEMIDLFLTYQNEAMAARKLLDETLNELSSGSEILEIGGGILALAIQLASEGFKVTTVEPVGDGFGGIPFIMSIFIKIAKMENLNFNFIETPIEDCKFKDKFDFIFSFNVMEHLQDPYAVLIQLNKTLKVDGKHRFICPNYDFPYEPHFGKWLVSRSNKAFFLPIHRADSPIIPKGEALALYKSINFLTLKKMKRNLKGKGFSISVNRNSLYKAIVRSLQDSELRRRHKGLAYFAKLLFLLRLHYLAKLFPVNYQPIMDVEVTSLSD